MVPAHCVRTLEPSQNTTLRHLSMGRNCSCWKSESCFFFLLLLLLFFPHTHKKNRCLSFMFSNMWRPVAFLVFRFQELPPWSERPNWDFLTIIKCSFPHFQSWKYLPLQTQTGSCCKPWQQFYFLSCINTTQFCCGRSGFYSDKIVSPLCDDKILFLQL